MCATHYTHVPPWGHARPREPGHTATRRRGRARLPGLSALRAARQGHTRPRSLTPTPRRRRFRARAPAPPGNLTGRAGMSSRRRPPGRPPPLNWLQMPGGPRPRLRRAPALGRPLQVAGGPLRGRGLGCASGKGRGFSRSPAQCLSWAPGGGLLKLPCPPRVASRPRSVTLPGRLTPRAGWRPPGLRWPGRRGAPLPSPPHRRLPDARAHDQVLQRKPRARGPGQAPPPCPLGTNTLVSTGTAAGPSRRLVSIRSWYFPEIAGHG